MPSSNHTFNPFHKVTRNSFSIIGGLQAPCLHRETPLALSGYHESQVIKFPFHMYRSQNIAEEMCLDLSFLVAASKEEHRADSYTVGVFQPSKSHHGFYDLSK